MEVKNRLKVTSSDVAAFEAKVRAGVADGLFDGGLFVSQRCPIPGMTSCARQSLLDDPDGRPTVPMAYVCAERGAPPRPVLAEHVEVVLQAHAHLCEQASSMRAALAGREADERDAQRLQAHFSELSSFMSEMFSEFGRHQSILDSARKSLDAMKQACLVAYRTSRRLNSSVPWLQRPMPPLACERGVDHAVRLAAEGRLQWANVTHRDAVFSSLGKDCATQVVHEELRLLSKEAREESGGSGVAKRPREQ